jgi:hypothetical protein
MPGLPFPNGKSNEGRPGFRWDNKANGGEFDEHLGNEAAPWGRLPVTVLTVIDLAELLIGPIKFVYFCRKPAPRRLLQPMPGSDSFLGKPSRKPSVRENTGKLALCQLRDQ